MYKLLGKLFMTHWATEGQRTRPFSYAIKYHSQLICNAHIKRRQLPLETCLQPFTIATVLKRTLDKYDAS